jgi:alpha-methylacyl-CoA racemase
MSVTRIRPLDGIRILEMGSLAPGPMCAMMLGNFGAEVTLVERPAAANSELLDDGPPLFSRGKVAVEADLKSPRDVARVIELAANADVLLEGYRPGVMERLGLGPDVLLARNEKLIYTRLTGWGQDGPYSQRAGHDINYIAAAGALAQIGIEEPTAPATFLGDFAGGSFLAMIGILLALQARERTGRGQVVDAAIVDGVAALMSAQLEMYSRDLLLPRGRNVVDGRAPFYRSYQCADGKWYSVGSIEPHFYRALLDSLGLTDEPTASQYDEGNWDALREKFAAIFRTRTCAEWDDAISQADACGAPVLEVQDLITHPHLRARRTYVDGSPGLLAGVAPRLSDTPGRLGPTYQRAVRTAGTNVDGPV